MRYLVLLVLVLGLAACGGSSTTTLHGTYTDLEGFSPLNVGQSCQAQEPTVGAPPGGYVVAVAVDNIPAAQVPVTWRGNARTVTIDGSTTTACTGTWSATVKTASTAYQITMPGDGGFGGTNPIGGPASTVDISPANAGKAIALYG